MEVGGFLQAAKAARDLCGTIFVPIRGISDPANPDKNRIEAVFERAHTSGRAYCMRNAARLVYCLLHSGALPAQHALFIRYLEDRMKPIKASIDTAKRFAKLYAVFKQQAGERARTSSTHASAAGSGSGVGTPASGASGSGSGGDGYNPGAGSNAVTYATPPAQKRRRTSSLGQHQDGVINSYHVARAADTPRVVVFGTEAGVRTQYRSMQLTKVFELAKALDGKDGEDVVISAAAILNVMHDGIVKWVNDNCHLKPQPHSADAVSVCVSSDDAEQKQYVVCRKSWLTALHSTVKNYEDCLSRVADKASERLDHFQLSVEGLLLGGRAKICPES